jgi:hypothetical protein
LVHLSTFDLLDSVNITLSLLWWCALLASLPMRRSLDIFADWRHLTPSGPLLRIRSCILLRSIALHAFISWSLNLIPSNWDIRWWVLLEFPSPFIQKVSRTIVSQRLVHHIPEVACLGCILQAGSRTTHMHCCFRTLQ